MGADGNGLNDRPIPNLQEMQASAAAASRFLKVLANQHRLLVLCHLIEGEKSVGELEERLGLRQPHLSQQLARLRQDGLVRTRRDARTIFYDLDSAAAVEMLELLYKLFCAPGSTGAGSTRPSVHPEDGASRPLAALPSAQPGPLRRG